MLINVYNLTGSNLDQAAAKALDLTILKKSGRSFCTKANSTFSPSTNSDDAQILVDAGDIRVWWRESTMTWVAQMSWTDREEDAHHTCNMSDVDKLVAITQIFVRAKLGEQVSIPIL